MTPIPSNRAPFNMAELMRATQAQVQNASDLRTDGVATDTRVELAGKLFVALRGERFDGHQYLEQAVRQGARAVLVEQPNRNLGVPQLVVPSTLRALGELARFHRMRFSGRVVAVAGSAGKTTTRRAISRLLDSLAPGQVCSTPGNLNNRIGVPMVLLGLESHHRHAVVEIGTNQTGEVAELARLARPDVSLLTLVDVEHAEGLGSLDQIEREEGAVLRGAGTSGYAIANADDSRAMRQLNAAISKHKRSYGFNPTADYRIHRQRSLGTRGSEVTIERRGSLPLVLTTGLLGRAGAYAVTAAVAAGEALLGAPLASSQAAAFAGLGPDPGRLEPREMPNGTLILDDSYNSNPASLRSSIGTAAEIAEARGARLVLVIGEMRELGAASEAEHRAMGQAIAATHAAATVVIGAEALPLADAACQGSGSVTYAADASSAVIPLLQEVLPGDVVLVKASRGVGAERVVEALVGEMGKAA